jgi:Alg9-like mannosyltransferase family
LVSARCWDLVEAIFASCRAQRDLAAFAAWSLAIYSLPAHKEFRFLLPALQLLMPYCGVALAAVFQPAREPAQRQQPQQEQQQQLEPAGSVTNSSTVLRSRHQAAAPGHQPDSKQQQQPLPLQQQSAWARRRRRTLRLAAAAALLMQLPAAAYFGLVHQRCRKQDSKLGALAPPHRHGRPTSRCICMLYSEAIMHIESMHPTPNVSPLSAQGHHLRHGAPGKPG